MFWFVNKKAILFKYLLLFFLKNSNFWNLNFSKYGGSKNLKRGM